MIASMSEVLQQAKQGHHPLLLETADYWLSLGLTIGLDRPEAAKRLLHLIEAEESGRNELQTDGDTFTGEVLG